MIINGNRHGQSFSHLAKRRPLPGEVKFAASGSKSMPSLACFHFCSNPYVKTLLTTGSI